ncbi:MAG: hypothetical protein ACTTIC_01730 [Helicobacteraceae bacterium]
MDKNGFVASLGYSVVGTTLEIKNPLLNKTYGFSGSMPNFTLGYKYENFLASFTFENGDLENDKFVVPITQKIWAA